jgi:hypothetical protein
MSLKNLQKIIGDMDPEEALAVLAVMAKDLFPLLGDEARLKFVMSFTGDAGKDRITSLVHL